MKRSLLVAGLVAFVFALVATAAGCGCGEETTASPDTITGTLPTETEPTDTEPTDTEPPAEGDAEAGRAVFLGSAGCGACHTLADAGTSGTVGPNLDETQPSYELALDRITNGRGAMPAFAGTLSEEEIANVSAYVAEEAGG